MSKKAAMDSTTSLIQQNKVVSEPNSEFGVYYYNFKCANGKILTAAFQNIIRNDMLIGITLVFANLHSSYGGKTHPIPLEDVQCIYQVYISKYGKAKDSTDNTGILKVWSTDTYDIIISRSQYSGDLYNVGISYELKTDQIDKINKKQASKTKDDI